MDKRGVIFYFHRFGERDDESPQTWLVLTIKLFVRGVPWSLFGEAGGDEISVVDGRDGWMAKIINESFRENIALSPLEVGFVSRFGNMRVVFGMGKMDF